MSNHKLLIPKHTINIIMSIYKMLLIKTINKNILYYSSLEVSRSLKAYRKVNKMYIIGETSFLKLCLLKFEEKDKEYKDINNILENELYMLDSRLRSNIYTFTLLDSLAKASQNIINNIPNSNKKDVELTVSSVFMIAFISKIKNIENFKITNILDKND